MDQKPFFGALMSIGVVDLGLDCTQRLRVIYGRACVFFHRKFSCNFHVSFANEYERI